MGTLKDRWAKDNLSSREVTVAEQEAFIKLPTAKIYKPFGINTDEINLISERIFATAVKKHNKELLSKTEIDQAESDYLLLVKKAEGIKDEQYVRRLIWESATEVDFIKGLKNTLSPRLVEKTGKN